MEATMTAPPAPVHAADVPDPEVPERAKRRRFTAQEKLRILTEVDKAPAGQTASICRREQIYSSQLATWRQQRKDGSIERIGEEAWTKGRPAGGREREAA